uniref:Cytochrome P450 n=1 Tax=Salvator merianae TaxID=96440 RepID=A0A8D0KJV2_SALMN
MKTVSETIANTSWIFHLIFILSLIYGLLKAIQFYGRKRYMVRVLQSFPGPPSHWLYGHLKMLEQDEELLNMTAWTEKYPHCHPLWYGIFLGFLNINHPEYAKTILSRGGKEFDFYIWLYGLLILDGPKWQQHRKLLTPGFHYDILKSYVTLMADSVKEMLDIWEKLILKDATKSVEIYKYASLMSLDTIMKCAFSYQSRCQTDRNNSYINTVLDLSAMFEQRLKTPLYHSDLIYQFSPQGRQFFKACKLAHLHTDNVIRERKESLKNEHEREKILKKRRLDFLDILLCAKDERGNSLSDEDIRAEVDTFMFRGHDTTASGFSWLLYCMAQNPEHQQRCREEIKEVLGPQEVIQWDDLGKLTYTTMCIKESFRLYPPVPLVGRELNSPVTFADGQTLPKGLLPLLSDDSHLVLEVYDPLRFSLENSNSRHPYAFLPFVAGPRNCIGQQFAMNEMKVALALTLSRFELLPDPSKPSIPIAQLVTRSKNGIYLKLKTLC